MPGALPDDRAADVGSPHQGVQTHRLQRRHVAKKCPPPDKQNRQRKDEDPTNPNMPAAFGVGKHLGLTRTALARIKDPASIIGHRRSPLKGGTRPRAKDRRLRTLPCDRQWIAALMPAIAIRPGRRSARPGGPEFQTSGGQPHAARLDGFGLPKRDFLRALTCHQIFSSKLCR